MTAYLCERAWLGPGDIADNVLVEVEGTHITAVTPSWSSLGGTRLAGLTIPGFANCHSHVFHRALRGRTQRERGSFWTWRQAMYDVAARLQPDTYYALAHATYREMALAGITAVGEFHYLHHDSSGSPYSDPNAMGLAVIEAARDAGLRIAILDTCYLSSGFGAVPGGVQVRFSDGSADNWAERVSNLADRFEGVTDRHVVVGSAIHSVRAVPRDSLATVANVLPERPVHIHLSEQVAENEACHQYYGRTPTQLLGEAGILSDRLTAVHATHLTAADIALLGGASVYVDFCPTTERDLADGIGPSRALADAGARLTLGSDSHAVIDMHEEMRAVELDERLASQQRGHWQSHELLTAATETGHRSLGFTNAGRIAPGQWADLVTIDTSTPRTAGTGQREDTVVFAATAADITSVVASGVRLERDHETVGRSLDSAIAALTGEMS
ncbi:MAG: formimidoylglutamate deiminase [Nocardioidaceae bacterium]|nr:formimidoylglutamate deiminase [Nocardioidaceae bacterium]